MSITQSDISFDWKNTSAIPSTLPCVVKNGIRNDNIMRHVVTDLYRLRTIKQLLGDYPELESQEIYFAHPSDLNDPMEGTRNIFWLGEQIVWRNLFKHYIYCFHMTCAASRILGDVDKFKPQHIPIMLDFAQNWTPKETKLFDNIWERIFYEQALVNFLPHWPVENERLFAKSFCSTSIPSTLLPYSRWRMHIMSTVYPRRNQHQYPMCSASNLSTSFWRHLHSPSKSRRKSMIFFVLRH